MGELTKKDLGIIRDILTLFIDMNPHTGDAEVLQKIVDKIENII